MNISAYSIKNPLVAILFFTLMMILGIYGFLQMKIQQFPDIDFPGGGNNHYFGGSIA